MANLIDIQVDPSGAVQALRALEPLLQNELRRFASVTGQEVRDRARANAPVAPAEHRRGFHPGTYRDSIVSVDGPDATRVFAQLPAAVPFNLDIWLEFGTSRQMPQPHLWPAADAVRARYNAGVAARVQRVIGEVSS
jgi:hypothetical protein